ncbi:MAG: hypothetical protein ACJ76A_09630 [Actinomycetota bacterium]
MSLTRKSLIAVVISTVVLGLLALPGNAAPEKQFSLTFPTSLTAGTVNIPVTLKNETPNGNSNINSFRITASTAPSGFRINSITPGSGALSNNNQTISVTGINTLKPLQSAVYQLNVTVPNVGCNGGTVNWAGQAWTGNSLNGDPFRLHTQTESNPSQLTSTITSGCNTITVNKYEDTNVNGTKQTGEAAPTQSFSFDLKQGSTVLQTKSTTAGVATFDAVTQGSYSVCESTPLPSGWHNTDPGGTSACKSFTTSGATTSLSFGNAHDVTININKFNDANLDGTQNNNESGLSGWSFTLDGNAISGSTANDGSLSTTAAPGVSHDVCEVPQTNWFSTTGGNCQTIAASDASSSATVSLDFGNALGNLDCGANDTITTEDGRATVTRLQNTDGSDCILKPATLTHNGTMGGPDGENVEFLVTGDQPAAYEMVINWDPVGNTNPPSAPATTIDLPGGTHPLKWCGPDGSDLNSEPDLPAGEVGCIVKQEWNFTDATHVQETETIYLEADIVLSKKT